VEGPNFEFSTETREELLYDKQKLLENGDRCVCVCVLRRAVVVLRSCCAGRGGACIDQRRAHAAGTQSSPARVCSSLSRLFRCLRRAAAIVRLCRLRRWETEIATNLRQEALYR
jgi:hypothetical protein